MSGLSLTDLAARTGVTPRTVRYYIAQGLLPAPLEQGRGAHYSDGHANRIRLIKRLQREHLPLAEIRTRLASLEDGQVHRALAEADTASLAETPAPLLSAAPEPPGASALRYIRRVLDEGSTRGPGRVSALRRVMPTVAPASAASAQTEAASPNEPAPKPGIAPGAPVRGRFDREVPDEYPLPAFPGRPTHHRTEPDRPMAFPPPGLPPADRSTWERIALTADLELHVRRPLDRETNRILDRLMSHARELLADR